VVSLLHCCSGLVGATRLLIKYYSTSSYFSSGSPFLYYIQPISIRIFFFLVCLFCYWWSVEIS
jgi:hypothetical protein